MEDPTRQLFDELSASLSAIEARFTGSTDMMRLPDDHSVDPDPPELRVVAAVEDDESDQTEDVSGKIAALNDRFRQTHATQDDEIEGEWIMGDDIAALPVPTKDAIKRRIGKHSEFEECPLRDRGAFDYESKGTVYPVIWQIRVYDDASKTTEAEHPDDPQRSYRAMLVTLSDQADGEA